jgi:hypothetical protein
MWFETLTGFHEKSPQQVRKNISIHEEKLKSLVNGREFIYGKLEIPSLAQLRSRVEDIDLPARKISLREVVADVQALHADPANRDALFQVASQFNLLEMVSPDITPEDGIDRYAYDHTQGPACAIAAGAGTIYRNYFANVHGQIGQTVDNQIDCLLDMGKALGNTDNRLWKMKNGYALPSEKGLEEIARRLRAANSSEIDKLRGLLRIGMQYNTEVTIADTKHTVSQAYCAALPVAYCPYPAEKWSEFAQLVLEAAYEATFCAAVLNLQATGNNKLYLTLLGGGAFGNKTTWIIDAIRRSLNLYKDFGLDVVIVSYGSSNSYVQQLILSNPGKGVLHLK